MIVLRSLLIGKALSSYVAMRLIPAQTVVVVRLVSYGVGMGLTRILIMLTVVVHLLWTVPEEHKYMSGFVTQNNVILSRIVISCQESELLNRLVVTFSVKK